MDGDAPEPGQLVEHLFRHEAGRMLAALVRVLGLHNLALAEDLVQETLLRALETWRFGVPANAAAWLQRTARNCALDAIRRERSNRRFAPDLGYLLDSEWTAASTVDGAFLAAEIRDEQLRLMFSCCHPHIAPEGQSALMLGVLCGFGTAEIARAFLTTPAAIEKRLARGKEALRRGGVLFDVSDDASFRARLDAVLGTLYLLFNEGYHGSHPELPVRGELCFEAMRLAILLTEHRAGAEPRAFALVALMCLHAARLPARLGKSGLVLLEEQDRDKWDPALIARGLDLLRRASTGDEASAFHLEAAIAAEHCLAPTFAATDWRAITRLYDLLLALRPSPIVALNRAVAIGLADGPDAGLVALGAIADAGRLAGYPFLAAARGELLRRAGRPDEAATAFAEAAALARNDAEARVFRERAAACR